MRVLWYLSLFCNFWLISNRSLFWKLGGGGGPACQAMESLTKQACTKRSCGKSSGTSKRHHDEDGVAREGLVFAAVH